MFQDRFKAADKDLDKWELVESWHDSQGGDSKHTKKHFAFERIHLWEVVVKVPETGPQIPHELQPFSD